MRSTNAADTTATAVNSLSSAEKKEIKKQNRRRRAESFRRSRYYKIMHEKGVGIFLLSFIIPFAIMTFAFAQGGVYPFGNNQMLVVDLWHQYYPFFRVEREKLLTNGSFLYSWQNGLGTNFLSLISYYEASPLNWISVFFPKDYVREALTTILLMKIGFAGAFFSCFLRYTFGRKDFSLCIFSTMFALSSYTLGYYWNVMWFDTIALFPLVMLGIVAICREGKWKTFTFALALSLFSNYYIAFFTCIFSIFMFAAAGIIEFRGIKKWLYSFWIMLRSSILALCLSAFMLLPAYFGLKMTYSIENKFPKDTVKYENWKTVSSHLLSYDEPTKVEGLPNFACGMLAVLLFGVFLLSFGKNGIKIREKISAVLMLVLIVVSCNINKLNFIWHGFHFTNQIPYRFAFIFCFVLVTAAFRAYDIMMKNGVKVYQLILMLFAPAAVFSLYYVSEGDNFKFNGAFKSSIIITTAFWFIFIAARIFPDKNRQLKNKAVTIGIAAAVFAELVSNAKLGVETVKTTARSAYPACQEEIETLLELAEKTDKTPFYRTEVTATQTLNDSALHGYYGLSQFSSAANVSVTTLCKRLGLYASEAGNRFYYRTATPVVNSILGIKYLIKKSGELNSEEMSMIFRGDSGERYDENGNRKTKSNLYQNKFALSLGFMMDEKILELPNASGANPFEYQNSLMKLATGTEKPIFTAQPVALVEYNHMTVTKHGFGDYSFRVEDEYNSRASSTYKFDCHDGSYLYGYAASTGGACDELSITCDSRLIDSGKLIESFPIVFPMGNGHEGSTSKVEVMTKEGKKTGNFKLMVYALSREAFEAAHKELADEQLNITSFEDTKIKGTIDVLKDGVMFFSIPYEKGWTVYVDGKKTETFSVLDAMLGIKLSEGHHDIELRYSPEGFVPGVIISSSALAVIILLCWYERRRKLRKAALSEETAEELTEAEAEDVPINDAVIYDVGEEGTDPPQEEACEKAEASEETEPSASPEESNEKSESDDSIPGDGVSRLSASEQCGDGSGDA